MKRTVNIFLALALLTLEVACATSTKTKDDPMTERRDAADPTTDVEGTVAFSPRFRKGDSWKVHYKIIRPSPRKSPDPEPFYQEYDWVYRVDEVDSSGVAVIVARNEHEQEGYPDEWRMRVSSNGVLLEVRATGTEAPELESGPSFTLRPDVTWNLSPDWPAFPVASGELVFDEGTLVQRVARAASTWSITLTRVENDPDYSLERTLVQEWEDGRPWWSSARVAESYTTDGKTESYMALEGQVTSWNPADTGAPR